MFDAMGWKEGVLLAAGMVTLYLLFLVARLVGLGWRKKPPTRAPAEVGAGETAKPKREAPDERRHEPVVSAVEPPSSAFQPSPASPRAAEEALAKAGNAGWSGDFGDHLSAYLAKSEMERELRELREEVARLRQEVESLRERRTVSPQYAEAMALIERGLTAREVAEELGIALAEAELVQALVKRGFDEETGEEDEHGNDTRA